MFLSIVQKETLCIVKKHIGHSRLQDYLARLEKQINEYDGENWIEKYAE